MSQNRRFHYDAALKRKIIVYAKQNENYAAERKFGVSEGNICWYLEVRKKIISYECYMHWKFFGSKLSAASWCKNFQIGSLCSEVCLRFGIILEWVIHSILLLKWILIKWSKRPNLHEEKLSMTCYTFLCTKDRSKLGTWNSKSPDFGRRKKRFE